MVGGGGRCSRSRCRWKGRGMLRDLLVGCWRLVCRAGLRGVRNCGCQYGEGGRMSLGMGLTFSDSFCLRLISLLMP